MSPPKSATDHGLERHESRRKKKRRVSFFLRDDVFNVKANKEAAKRIATSCIYCMVGSTRSAGMGSWGGCHSKGTTEHCTCRHSHNWGIVVASASLASRMTSAWRRVDTKSKTNNMRASRDNRIAALDMRKRHQGTHTPTDKRTTTGIRSHHHYYRHKLAEVAADAADSGSGHMQGHRKAMHCARNATGLVRRPAGLAAVDLVAGVGDDQSTLSRGTWRRRLGED
ncbi:hypothetical protein BC940DRAFT_309845 [Gongronella butleri]|nr:hypothetical protein BC940DRAFT_309845 [Gongronella butleri]